MLGLKQIGTICLLIFSFIFPTFATDPDISANTTSASCDSDVLNSENGPVDIEINWEPNTIQLYWYDGNTELTVSAESQSCVYDDGLVPPSTIPQREGYDFAGWRVKRMVLDPSIAGTNYTYSAANMTWTTNFPYGNVSGIALCSTTPNPGSGYTVGDPDESGGGQYCWCRATHPVLSRWVFRYDYGSSAICASDCAINCGASVRAAAVFRSPMFGSVAQ